MTGQFGKNHLGDRDEMLPTAPRIRRVLRQPLPPQRRGGAGEPRLSEGSRSSRRSSARAASSTVFADGKIEDTGPLTKKRMETIDEEVTAGGARLHGARQEGRQAVLPLVELHPHAHLHAPQEGVRRARPGSASMPTAWSSTTATSGSCSTSSRNSASKRTPSSCTPPTTARNRSPGRTAAPPCSAARRTRNWEGGYRVPTVIRWPGVIKPGTVINDIGAHEDMLPTLLAAAGDTRRQGGSAEGHARSAT